MDILIVDDSQADHDIIVEYLKDTAGVYRFYHAFTAAEGLDLYRANTIDCVLLDYNMPDNNGLELLKHISQEGASAPVIMITGEGNEFIAVTAMKLGLQDYIPKKVLSPAALKRAIDRAVEYTEVAAQMEKYRSELARSYHDLEQFANIVAHDLKAPLRAVTQHLTLISNRNKLTLDEKSQRSLAFAVEGAERMRLLIEALFEYARLGFSEPNFEAVSMETLLEHAKRDLAAVIGESKAVITCDTLPVVKGDSILLLQLLQNLIANAIKYCKETPRIHIDAIQDAGSWRISVQDNGIGIPEAQHKQIFAIFRRLHQEDEYPGIGLGLAICSRIVKQHGGIMGVESAPGQGSCFHFTLPSLAATTPSQQRKVAHA